MTYKQWQEQLEQGQTLLPHMTSDERAEYKGNLRAEHRMLANFISEAKQELERSDNPDFKRALEHWLKTNYGILQMQEKQLALIQKWDRRDKEERVQLR